MEDSDTIISHYKWIIKNKWFYVFYSEKTGDYIFQWRNKQ